jgi:hypothetical protein
MAYALLNRVPNFYNILYSAEVLILGIFAKLDVCLSLSAIAGYVVCTDPEIAKCGTLNPLDVLLDSVVLRPIQEKNVVITSMPIGTFASACPEF